VKLLKESHATELKTWRKDRIALAQKSDDMVAQLNVQMLTLRNTALEKIALLERQLSRAQTQGVVELTGI